MFKLFCYFNTYAYLLISEKLRAFFSQLCIENDFRMLEYITPFRPKWHIRGFKIASTMYVFFCIRPIIRRTHQKYNHVFKWILCISFPIEFIWVIQGTKVKKYIDHKSFFCNEIQHQWVLEKKAHFNHTKLTLKNSTNQPDFFQFETKRIKLFGRILGPLNFDHQLVVCKLHLWLSGNLPRSMTDNVVMTLACRRNFKTLEKRVKSPIYIYLTWRTIA